VVSDRRILADLDLVVDFCASPIRQAAAVGAVPTPSLHRPGSVPAG